MKLLYSSLLLISCCATRILSFIVVPEEVPSILSVLYSNIPPIKKGTDSRVGIGFRLGPNADLQVQFEIGPQTNTQPIGPSPPPSDNATSKKRQAYMHAAASSNRFNASNPSENWLNKWKLSMNEIPNGNEYENYRVMSDPTKEDVDFVTKLRQLYMKTSNDTL